MSTADNKIVDARGSVCPLPIIELAKAMRVSTEARLFVLLATDPAVEPDVRAFCAATGHELVRFEVAHGEARAWVKRRS